MTHYAGIEIGGTKLVAARGRGWSIAERVAIATTTPEETLGKAVRVLTEWHDHEPLSAIGVASFGPVRIDPAAHDYGKILATPKPGWEGTDLLAELSRFGIPVALDTDVNAAALAEARLGAGQGCDSLIYITIGTGIGGGVVVGGRPAHGLLHPELGHMMLRRVEGDDFAGVCPFHGDCLEGLVSGPALHARFAGDAAAADPQDPRWDTIASDLAQLLANLLLALSPQRIVIGGGVGLGQRSLVRRAADRVPQIIAGYLPEVDRAAMDRLIVPPALGADAGPLGAILLATDSMASAGKSLR
ncbi:ROK family protein [Croceicoccus marinus]|uniref:fructokinase n=1 Tax=Croceicoccus marinus TaxID=450378 RepID=A0A1Z1FA84_9SPHN|nr:ROK family protein [Croceicoccus marinus]ARU15607.1 fructokinase [Croceicoccus marinus]